MNGKKALAVMLAILAWIAFRKRWTEEVTSVITYDTGANIVQSSGYDDTW